MNPNILRGTPREFNLKNDKRLDMVNLSQIESAIRAVKDPNKRQKIQLMFDVLQRRTFASTDEVLDFNAELAGVGLDIRLVPKNESV